MQKNQTCDSNTLGTEALQNYKFKFEILYNKNSKRLMCKNNEFANNLVTNVYNLLSMN